ncbi:hypothetical protein E2C01_041226 [Portunus trituberculatus]|uniref:Uncharacterized protein n=1 Tax=Portunus trituberculatus TaxID=210409 RepID=A0A5B7FRC8_PORTR|nr:hypothetical protein [Portunus trituberculatus]
MHIVTLDQLGSLTYRGSHTAAPSQPRRLQRRQESLGHLRTFRKDVASDQLYRDLVPSTIRQEKPVTAAP